MTREEFKEYLESIDGLKSSYVEGVVIKSPDFFEFSEGWFQITKNLIDDLIKLGWDKRIGQAKEKFGTGRFYIGGATDPVWERIHKWEEETAYTCEVCGSQDESVSLRGHLWYTTRCNKCKKED
jgi:hypothetical protein